MYAGGGQRMVSKEAVFFSSCLFFLKAKPPPRQNAAMHEQVCFGSKAKEGRLLTFILEMFEDSVPSGQSDAASGHQIISNVGWQCVIFWVLRQQMIHVIRPLQHHQDLAVNVQLWIVIFFHTETSTGRRSLTSAPNTCSVLSIHHTAWQCHPRSSAGFAEQYQVAIHEPATTSQNHSLGRPCAKFT